MPHAAPTIADQPRDFVATPLLGTFLAAATPTPGSPTPGTPAPGNSETGLKKFSGVAYDGGPVQQWWGTTIVDLEGVEPLDQPLPLLLDHGWAAGSGFSDLNVGFVESMSVGDGGLVIAGALLDKESARGVIADAKQGYPWQLSIRAVPLRTEDVAAGASSVVNGRTVQGPITIFRQSLLREISVTHVGAAQSTRFDIAASQRSAAGSNRSTPMATSKTITAADMINPDDITADWLKANKRDVYDAVRAMEHEDGEGAEPVPETQASFEDLKVIFGQRNELIVAAMEAKATPSKAREMLAAHLSDAVKQRDEEIKTLKARLSAKAEAGGADPVPAGGKPPVTAGFAGATGNDAEADWKNSADLRASWNNQRESFMRHVKACALAGDSYLV